MIPGEFQFNIHEACMYGYRTYRAAYSISNEPLNNIIELLPVKNKRVLTVAASGDQPILYAAHGAAHVDTFDITYNARVIMDFKTTAIQTMNRKNYFKQIINLDSLCYSNQNRRFRRTVEKMPNDTRHVMNAFVAKRSEAFQRTDNGDKSNLGKMYQNWANIRKGIRRPFNFIWADLANLHKYIDGEYDIINLSNILEFYKSKKDILTTFQQLWPHVRIGGYIVCVAMGNPNNTIAEQHKLFSCIKHTPVGWCTIITIQKQY